MAKPLNFVVHDVVGDGNCLFRCVALALWGDESKHSTVRMSALTEIISKWDEFKDFIFDRQNNTFANSTAYYKYMGADGEYGTYIEIIGMGKAFKRNIIVYHKVGSEFKVLHEIVGNSEWQSLNLLFDAQREHYQLLKAGVVPKVSKLQTYKKLPINLNEKSHQQVKSKLGAPDDSLTKGTLKDIPVNVATRQPGKQPFHTTIGKIGETQQDSSTTSGLKHKSGSPNGQPLVSLKTRIPTKIAQVQRPIRSKQSDQPRKYFITESTGKNIANVHLANKPKSLPILKTTGKSLLKPTVSVTPSSIPVLHSDTHPSKIPIRRKTPSQVYAESDRLAGEQLVSETSAQSSIPAPLQSDVQTDDNGVTPPKVETTGTQTDAVSSFNDATIRKLRYQMRELKKNFRKKLILRDAKIETLQAELKTAKAEILHLSKFNVKKMISDSENGDEKAAFLLSLMHSYNQSRLRVPEKVLRACIVWYIKFPGSYKYVRETLLNLPSRQKMSTYLGPSKGLEGITPLIKQRLRTQVQELNDFEKYGSLVIDEMALDEKIIYDKNLDKYFGHTTMKSSSIANHLLCFVIVGLSTRYVIPVGYFFTRSVKAEQLFNFTQNVLELLHGFGYKIIRIVTDNHKVNRGMFKLFGDGSLEISIPHPCETDEENPAPLFFSFDPVHILKNIRNQFLDREMANGEGIITGEYLVKLYRLQKFKLVKLVRNLTRKHVMPSNLEKMNVARAIQVFSIDAIAALKTMRDNPYTHSTQFSDASSTIKFMEAVKKWFDVHNVGSTDSGRQTRNTALAPFTSENDERLDWLENEFLDYLEQVKQACIAADSSFFTKETYEAIIHTTHCTVQCIRYLLRNGFSYVLTRRFNSDPIESLFGTVRQMCGSNDMVDARSATFALEKFLKVGIVRTASADITEVRQDILRDGAENNDQLLQTENLATLESDLRDALFSIPDDSFYPDDQISALANVGGFILECVESLIPCDTCRECLVSNDRHPGLLFIRWLDRGGLHYPNRNFIKLLIALHQFMEGIFKCIDLKSPKLAFHLHNILMKHVIEVPFLCCPDDAGHVHDLCSVIVSKFVNAMLKNYAFKVNALVIKKRVDNKPLSRKVLRLA